MLSDVFGSSLGRKYVMALSGLLLFAFVIVHMLGNLQIFLGPVAINDYAAALKSSAWLLWSARLGLLVIFLVHVATALRLVIENREARPIKYAAGKPMASSYAARTIAVSGIVLLCFIAFHLAHLTFGFVDPGFLELRDVMGRHDVYRMMVIAFSNPVVVAFYLLSTGLLSLHLSHGIASSFQSLGIRNRKSLKGLHILAVSSATLTFLGNCSIPVAILAGVIK